ncbi:non-POU domain-containing octamer-binding protein [Platysternon megacephalum]|uniref:Non-POU domain-containing octamer-binding protein n=1 Tax=Platysternon megacephalum TaxID=55544 RepID=A0A4D9F549_9SAUR|nr:non-POU domain-containing octamer-binding protein [Platysternon megacephalum]
MPPGLGWGARLRGGWGRIPRSEGAGREHGGDPLFPPPLHGRRAPLLRGEAHPPGGRLKGAPRAAPRCCGRGARPWVRVVGLGPSLLRPSGLPRKGTVTRGIALRGRCRLSSGSLLAVQKHEALSSVH